MEAPESRREPALRLAPLPILSGLREKVPRLCHGREGEGEKKGEGGVRQVYMAQIVLALPTLSVWHVKAHRRGKEAMKRSKMGKVGIG